VLSGIPGDDDVDDHPVSLVVSDGKVLATQNFTISVANVNDPPVITGQHPVSTDEDTPFNLGLDDLFVDDPDDPPSSLQLLIEGGSKYSFQGTTITPAADYFGSIKVNARISDGKSTSEVYQVTVTVRAVNDPPIIHGQKNTLEVKHQTSLTISVSDLYFTDVDNNLNDLSVIILPDPHEIFQVEGNQITPVKDTVGPVELPVVLDDGQDISGEYHLVINILPLYNPPLFTSTPPMLAIVNKPYFYVANVTDPDEGDTLSISASMLPGWLQFNPDLKLLGGNPSVIDTGTVWVGLELTDGRHVVEQLYQLEVRLYNGNEASHQLHEGILISSLYPVPADESLFLVPARELEYLIQVMDLSGRIITSRVAGARLGSPLHLDLSGYSPGIYTLRVYAGKDTESRKFNIRH